MKNIKNNIILILFLLASIPIVKSQKNDEIGQIFSSLAQLESDSLRVRLLTKKAFFYTHSNADYSYRLADSAIKLSKSIHNNYLLSLSFMNMGLAHSAKGNIEKTLSYYDSALFIAEQRNDTAALASIYNNIGNIHRFKGDNKKALECFYSSIKFCKNDSVKIASKLGNIAAVYYGQNDFKKSIEVYLESVNMLEGLNRTRYLINSYNALASCYLEIKNYQKAQAYTEKALIMAIDNNDIKNESNSYANFGRIMFAQKHYKEGIENYQKAIKLSQQIKDKTGLLRGNLFLMDAYYHLNDNKNTIKYAELSLSIAEDISAFQSIKNSYHYLAKTYKKENDFKLAYHYLVLERELSDSLQSGEKIKQIAELNTKYETEKKEQEIKYLKQEQLIQKAENKSKTYLIILLLILMISVVITVFLIRKTEKTKHHQKVLKERTQEAEIQKKRFAKELHDGIGSNLTGIRLLLLSIQDSANTEKMDDIIYEIDKTHQSVRMLAYQAYPPDFDNYSLDEAIHDLVRRLSKTGSIKIIYSSIITMEWDDVSKIFQLTIYRIIQESLSNVIKHADAKNVTIQMIQRPGFLNIMIEDDGKGFDLSAIKKGLGLKNITERVEYINGRLNIDTGLGKGCNIIIDLPLKL